jgi:DNA-binding Lrp family transcriptional regulator
MEKTLKNKREIIFLYAENARIKIKEISQLLKKSSQRLKYNLKVIEKEELVYNPYTIFDYSYFGAILFKVYFKGAYIGEKDKSKIIKSLNDNKHVTSIFELSGEFDLVIEICAQNPSKFNKILKKICDETQTLKHYKIVLNIVTYIYPRTYITRNNMLHSLFPQYTIIGGDREIEEFNANEKEVIYNLLKEPKIWHTKLAKNSKINVKTAKQILKNLIKKNIIKGFKYVINTEKLGVNKFKMFIKLHNLTKEREEELMKYFENTKEIVSCHKTIGDWNLEINIESIEKTRIRHLTIEIRETFQDIIETFNIMEYYYSYKRTYLPEYLFEKDKENK